MQTGSRSIIVNPYDKYVILVFVTHAIFSRKYNIIFNIVQFWHAQLSQDKRKITQDFL